MTSPHEEAPGPSSNPLEPANHSTTNDTTTSSAQTKTNKAPYSLVVRSYRPRWNLEFESTLDTSTINVATLRQMIRAKLNGDDTKRRLVLLHNSKLLNDEDMLDDVVKPMESPPRPKGIEVEGPPPVKYAFILCNVRGTMTDEALEEERMLATHDPPARAPVGASADSMPAAHQAQQAPTRSAASFLPPPRQSNITTTRRGTPSGPRGFDRLLAASSATTALGNESNAAPLSGLSAAEVNALRLQFTSILASRHTSDSMPSPDTLRSMEDAWLDNSTSSLPGVSPTSLDEDGNPSNSDDDDNPPLALHDTLWKGMIMGFVWPLGCIGWLCRQDGGIKGGEEKISRQMTISVWVGFVFVVFIGVMRATG